MSEAYISLCRHVRPIGKLTCSAVHFETVNDLFFIQRMWGPDSARLSGVGRVFGCAVTELYFEMVGPYSRGTRNTVQLRCMAHTLNH